MPAIERQRAVESSYLIPGWCWPTELGALYDLLGDSTYHVDVGTFCGKSLYIAALAMPEGAQAWGVDAMVYHGHAPSMTWVQHVLEQTLAVAREQRRDVAVGWIKDDHLEVARSMRKIKQLATSVYLDADHHYAETLAAIEAWFPLVAAGGILCGHDFWTGDGSVIDAVTEFFSQRNLQFACIPGTRIWWHRKQ
jgi:cephalosporin hydroxylase